MKKSLLTIILVLMAAGMQLYGQSFDWNLRGGINLMQSHTEGKDVAVLYHAGVQAGIRITSFGFYGEALYSVNENQNGGDPVAYFTPSLLMKGFISKRFFLEFGGTYLTKTGSSEDSSSPIDYNPDKEAYLMTGLGFSFKVIQISIRSSLKSSYPIVQLTGAFKF